MKKFEHIFDTKYFSATDEVMGIHQELLDKRSEDGWEMVTSVYIPEENKVRIYWKKEIKQYNIPNTGPR